VTHRRTVLAVLGALLLGLAGTATASAIAATPRPSLTAMWNEFMCVSCHEPLPVAQSPQAISERDFVRTLITHGYTKGQIEQAMVAQYGESVLAKPPAQGFNLTVYILPPAILLAGIAILVVTLPRWRRRARASAAARPPTATRSLSSADQLRLEDELSRYPG
jgi:cytochrome c-type biogenesis protein CcmH